MPQPDTDRVSEHTLTQVQIPPPPQLPPPPPPSSKTLVLGVTEVQVPSFHTDDGMVAVSKASPTAQAAPMVTSASTSPKKSSPLAKEQRQKASHAKKADAMADGIKAIAEKDSNVARILQSLVPDKHNTSNGDEEPSALMFSRSANSMDAYKLCARLGPEGMEKLITECKEENKRLDTELSGGPSLDDLLHGLVAHFQFGPETFDVAVDECHVYCASLSVKGTRYIVFSAMAQSPDVTEYKARIKLEPHVVVLACCDSGVVLCDSDELFVYTFDAHVGLRMYKRGLNDELRKCNSASFVSYIDAKGVSVIRVCLWDSRNGRPCVTVVDFANGALVEVHTLPLETDLKTAGKSELFYVTHVLGFCDKLIFWGVGQSRHAAYLVYSEDTRFEGRLKVLEDNTLTINAVYQDRSNPSCIVLHFENETAVFLEFAAHKDHPARSGRECNVAHVFDFAYGVIAYKHVDGRVLLWEPLTERRRLGPNGLVRNVRLHQRDLYDHLVGKDGLLPQFLNVGMSHLVAASDAYTAIETAFSTMKTMEDDHSKRKTTLTMFQERLGATIKEKDALSVELSGAKEKMRTQEAELKSVKERCESLLQDATVDRCRALKAELDDVKECHAIEQRMKMNIIDALQTSSDLHAQKNEELLIAIGNKNNKLKNVEKELKAAQKQVQEANKELDVCKAECADLRGRNQGAAKMLETCTRDLERVTKELQEIRDAKDGLTEQTVKKDAKYADLERRFEQFKKQAATESEKLRKAIADAEASAEAKLSKQASVYKDNLAFSEKTHNATVMKCAQLEKHVNSDRAHIDELHSQLDELQHKLEEALEAASAATVVSPVAATTVVASVANVAAADMHRAEIDRYRADLDKYRADVDRYRTDLEKYRADVDKYRADKDKVDMENAYLRTQLKEVTDRWNESSLHTTRLNALLGLQTIPDLYEKLLGHFECILRLRHQIVGAQETVFREIDAHLEMMAGMCGFVGVQFRKSVDVAKTDGEKRM